MGSVFGKETVLEPQFKTILERTSVVTTYQIREYGKRFAGTCSLHCFVDETSREGWFCILCLARRVGQSIQSFVIIF